MRSLAATATLCLAALAAQAQKNPLVVIESAERTPNSIVLKGQTKILPGGLDMQVDIKKINGKDLGNREVIQAEHVVTGDDGKFVASLQRHGSLGGYDFPDGKYVVEFWTAFVKNTQTMEVRKKVGVVIDAQGFSDVDDPLKGLPQSSDLPPSNFLKKGGRRFSAIRTFELQPIADAVSRYKTKSIKLELNDYKANRNPVRSIPATGLLVDEVAKKVGRLNGTTAVALICDGAGYGYIAEDLYRDNGRMNSSFSTNHYTTLMEVCHQMEDSFEAKKAVRHHESPR